MSSPLACKVFDDGWRHGVVCKEGREYAHVVVMGCPIDSRRIQLDVLDDQVTYIERDGAQVARQMLDSGKRLGITERARKLLEEVAPC